MFCKNCGKEIDDNAIVCPHCGVQVRAVNDQNGQPYNGQPYNGQPYNGQPNGQPYNGQPYNGQPYNGQPYNGQPYGQQDYVPGQNSQTNSNGIAIVGFVFSFLFALVGLICSIIGFKNATKDGAPHKGLALAGIIISAINMVAGFILSSQLGSLFASLL